MWFRAPLVPRFLENIIYKHAKDSLLLFWADCILTDFVTVRGYSLINRSPPLFLFFLFLHPVCCRKEKNVPFSSLQNDVEKKPVGFSVIGEDGCVEKYLRRFLLGTTNGGGGTITSIRGQKSGARTTTYYCSTIISESFNGEDGESSTSVSEQLRLSFLAESFECQQKVESWINDKCESALICPFTIVYVLSRHLFYSFFIKSNQHYYCGCCGAVGPARVKANTFCFSFSLDGLLQAINTYVILMIYIFSNEKTFELLLILFIVQVLRQNSYLNLKFNFFQHFKQDKQIQVMQLA